MTPFPVFTSYAQLDRDKYLEKFVDEFRKQLRSLTGGADPVALAFFDRDGVKAGDRWSAKITEAVGTADVLLCLMSPTYFTREWCGRELEAFLRRQSRLPPPAADVRFIFPIWWQVPPTPRPLPSRLGAYNYRDPSYPSGYESAGVRGLARQGRWKQFRLMVDRLAQLVSQTLAQPHRLPAAEAVADILAITNAFDEQQPFDVRLVVLTPGGDAWVPTAADASIEEAAAEAARRLLVYSRKLVTGPTLIDRLRQAQADQQVILVVTDAASAPDATLHTINGLDLPNLALLLVDVGVPAVGGDTWLAQFTEGALARAKSIGLMRVANAGDMCAQMERLVDEARRRLQAAAPVARAEDANLAAIALTQGISIDVQPNLTGPASEKQQ